MWNSIVDYGAIGNSLKEGVAWSLWEQIHNNQTVYCRNKYPVWLESLVIFFLLHWNGAVRCSGAFESKMNIWSTQRTWVFSSSCFWIQPWAKSKRILPLPAPYVSAHTQTKFFCRLKKWPFLLFTVIYYVSFSTLGFWKSSDFFFFLNPLLLCFFLTISPTSAQTFCSNYRLLFSYAFGLMSLRAPSPLNGISWGNCQFYAP